MFTIYNIQAFRKLSEGLQESILGGVILVYDRYSEQSVFILTKRRTQTPAFFGEIIKNVCLWTAASEQLQVAACNVIGILL